MPFRARVWLLIVRLFATFLSLLSDLGCCGLLGFSDRGLLSDLGRRGLLGFLLLAFVFRGLL